MKWLEDVFEPLMMYREAFVLSSLEVARNALHGVSTRDLVRCVTSHLQLNESSKANEVNINIEYSENYWFWGFI